MASLKTSPRPSRKFPVCSSSPATPPSPTRAKPSRCRTSGRELGVQYVLEGSVRKANDQVRITAQLIDAATESHLWAQRYDRPLKDIFALQDEIVQKIVTTLKLQLTLREQGYLVRKTTDNLEAYDATCVGWRHGTATRKRPMPRPGSCLRKRLRWTRSMPRRTRG